MDLRSDVLVEGLCFGEGPRWHEGRLWFSDMHARHVMTTDLDGKTEVVVEVPGDPSGLGWLPEDGGATAGRLLVVSMRDRRLLRLDPEGLVEVANLFDLASYHCNDMVVDARGNAYVGNFGFDLHGDPSSFRKTALILVTPEGAARVVADDLAFPNGTVITPDGRTLIVGESFGARLTAFQVAEDGSLSGRRIWAQLEGAVPDGICLDAEGGIWVASPVSGECLRVREGGDVTHRVRVEHQAFACMLGGDDRRTLFVLTAETSQPEECVQKRTARIETVRVDVPGTGLP